MEGTSGGKDGCGSEGVGDEASLVDMIVLFNKDWLSRGID